MRLNQCSLTAVASDVVVIAAPPSLRRSYVCLYFRCLTAIASDVDIMAVP